MQEKEGSGSLIKYAFTNQYNIIALLGAGGLSFALESWIPTVAAGVGEVLWLLAVPSTRSYRRWVAGQSAAQKPPTPAAEPAPATSRRLDEPYAARVAQLNRVIEEIRQLAIEREMDPSIFDRGGDRLQALVQNFVQMATLHQRLVRFLAGAQAGSLEQEVARLGREMASEKDAGVRLTMRQTVTVAQRRLKQHEQIDGTRRALEAKMQTLEMSFDYLRSQVFAGGAEADVENQLDELAAAVSFLPDLDAEASATIASVRSTTTHRSEGHTPVS